MPKNPNQTENATKVIITKYYLQRSNLQHWFTLKNKCAKNWRCISKSLDADR